MRILILGQPRTGKTILSTRLKEHYGIPVMHTDRYRREWGYHCPWKGYSTEIPFEKQNAFYQQLQGLYMSYEDIILEGSAIYPDDRDLFPHDSAVLLFRDVSSDQMLKDVRKYDDKDSWTSKRDDSYLLTPFSDYLRYSEEWVRKCKTSHPELCINTTDFQNGIDTAFQKICDDIDNADREG